MSQTASCTTLAGKYNPLDYLAPSEVQPTGTRMCLPLARIRATHNANTGRKRTLKNNGLRWARLCLAVTLTTLLTLSGLVPANAARKHKAKRETAAKHHVTAKKTKSGRKSHSSASHGENRSSKKHSERSASRSKKHSERTASRTKKHSGPSVGGEGVSLRSAPGTDSRRITLTEKGTHLRIVKKRKGWLQVRLPDGKSGWMRSDFVAGKHKIEAEKSHASRKSKRVAAHKSDSRKSKKKEIAKKSTEHNRRGQRLARLIPEADRPEAAHDIIRTAYAYRGTPYRYGGSAGGGFDCSGFTSYLYRRKGISLPHSASGQFHQGNKISKGDLEPGDLVFFSTVTRGISHVGMYVGEGKFVHSSSRRSGGVRVDSLASGYYSERFRGGRRYSK